MVAILLSIVILGIAILAWAARMKWANDVTCDQRLAMIESWRSLLHDDYLPELKSFRSVSYNRHMREVFWGRDPYKLYPHLKEVK
ncbi:hypothetical protein [Stenotrophomonas maltophilia]|uniref:hypothetical protein n=1 Tax=Stenotrophomonas maltophilia TaxID=40324 RepID=UPI0007F8EBF4|nr:hypothetical protein [Stenotrophomonas maltophilia]OBU59199.1 hypothetical protein A9K70_01365 [Stenotrophomonas maltophilia]